MSKIEDLKAFAKNAWEKVIAQTNKDCAAVRDIPGREQGSDPEEDVEAINYGQESLADWKAIQDSLGTFAEANAVDPVEFDALGNACTQLAKKAFHLSKGRMNAAEIKAQRAAKAAERAAKGSRVTGIKRYGRL